MASYVRNSCRLCESLNIKIGFSLTPTPPANEFVKEPVDQHSFPLDVYRCEDCGHIQLNCVVDPEILFRNYVYVSGTSPVFVKHFENYADALYSRFSIKPDDLIVEIGSNDGTFLNCFMQHGSKLSSLVGFEPATKIAQSAVSKYGVDTLPYFFDSDGIAEFKKLYGERKAKIVTANNVFAHSDNLRSIAKNIASLLDDKGVFVFEVSYFLDVYQKCLFDTIYHEHVSYHTVHPLLNFFSEYGLNLYDVERVDTHGGSIRCYVDKNIRSETERLRDILGLETDYGFNPNSSVFPDPMIDLKLKILNLKNTLIDRLQQLKSDGKVMAGYGAPAKATTLMYEFGLGKDEIDFIIDDSPWKQGALTPGKHVPVLPSSAITTRKPDYLVILAWNFADSIMEKHKEFSNNGGKFIVPIPELKEY